jgi:hypothetical protein
VVTVLCDNGEEGGEKPYGFEYEVEIFRPTLGYSESPSDVTLSRIVELRRAGADEGGLGAAESTESASGKESVESVVWERWDKEADRGEMGGKSARGVEREKRDVERKEEIFLTLSRGAVFGRRPPFLTARS